MRILILGGTVFLGRHLVEAAVTRGHEVVLFNRGRHAPQLFAGLQRLTGDRDGDLSALHGRRFDAVIDASGYRPQQMRVASLLDHARLHYVFISSISVGRSFAPGRMYDEGIERAAGDEGYGALKARCEEAIEAALPGRSACVRPGLIAGPFDPTGRFGYWPRRVARGGEVLAPGRPQRPVQWIDARDLASWCVRLAEDRQAGIFNAVGPELTLTMAQLLDTCRSVTGSDARWRWIGDASLVAAGVQPWTELPLWIPESDAEFGGLMLADNRRARDAGLCFRALAETVRATLDADAEAQAAPATTATLSAAREVRLLADFSSR